MVGVPVHHQVYWGSRHGRLPVHLEVYWHLLRGVARVRSQHVDGRLAPGARQRVLIDGSLRGRTLRILTAPISPGRLTVTVIVVPTFRRLRIKGFNETVPRALRLV